MVYTFFIIFTWQTTTIAAYFLQIQIAVSVIEVEMCCDHLYIYDGEGTKAELISSKAEPHTLYTTGNRAYITFSSDGSLERIGFSISYVTLSGLFMQLYIDMILPFFFSSQV